MPWRRTRDPYSVWVSEIMCQQTRVETVIPFFERWMETFPTVQALAAASEQEVLAVWQGLGYYRRARFLHQGAKWVADHGYPTSAAEWRQVPGVGAYTAGAIASICLHEATPVVDGNVERVYARFCGSHESGATRTKSSWAWATEILTPATPGEWNQALMELGARVCTPQNPVCDRCPVRMECAACARGETALLPIKNVRRQNLEVVQTVVIELYGSEIAFVQYGAEDWWTGLHGFPQVNEPLLTDERLPRVRHQVTHHKIEFQPFLRRVSSRTPDRIWVEQDELGNLPVAAPFRKMLKTLFGEQAQLFPSI